VSSTYFHMQLYSTPNTVGSQTLPQLLAFPREP
jgi:hypothetical protein